MLLRNVRVPLLEKVDLDARNEAPEEVVEALQQIEQSHLIDRGAVNGQLVIDENEQTQVRMELTEYEKLGGPELKQSTSYSMFYSQK